MLKILWKRGEIAPEEQFLLLSTIFCYLRLYLYVKTRVRFSLRDKRLFEITEVEITKVDCICYLKKELISNIERKEFASTEANSLLSELTPIQKRDNKIDLHPLNEYTFNFNRNMIIGDFVSNLMSVNMSLITFFFFFCLVTGIDHV